MNLGAPEVIILILVLLLLFGAKKLPELARGTGRALRIFKSETKGLMDDDDDALKTDEQRAIEAQRRVDAARLAQQQEPQPLHESRPDADR